MMFQFGDFCGKLLGIINLQVQMCDRKDFCSKAGVMGWQHEGMIGWSSEVVSVKFLDHELWRFVIDQEITGVIPFSLFCGVPYGAVLVSFLHFVCSIKFRVGNHAKLQLKELLEVQQAPNQPI